MRKGFLTVKKAFFAALAFGALGLLVAATTASSARPSSLQHYMIGFNHSPNASDEALVKSHGGSVRYSFPSIGVLAVDLAPDQVNDVKQATGVSYVESDPVRSPLSLSNDLLTSEYPATADNGLYGLVTTHTVEAQAAGYLGAGVKACVADTGLDTTQSDIAPNFVAGYDAFDPSKPTVDVNQLHVATTETHATHVSGIILGAINGSGIHGVAPAAKLLEARVLGTQPDGVTVEGSTSQVMAGVQWLADHGCKVINMSLGGGDKSQSEEALYNQVRANGTLIVVASGNDSSKKVSFPGAYQSVVTVGAVDKNNQLASFSNTGAQLDVVAPGVDNLSSFPAGQGRDAFVTAGGHDISGLPLEFAPATDGITGPLVNCGLGQTAADCGANPPANFVALIQRGAVSFAQKVDSALHAGAAAAILYNNAANGPGNFNGTLGTPDDNGTPWIPAVSLSQTDGEALAASGIATATVHNIAMAWNYDSGTSMATPHVSGVAALIFGKNPNLTPDQVETILERTATDLGVPNYDTTYGWGLVNAQAALAATPAP
jgi:subtilisin family serine protease